MPPPRLRAARFHYDGYTIDAARGEVRCTYSTDGHSFTERYGFGTGGDWRNPAVEAAVRILFLLAGVSYYKTSAAHVIDLGTSPSFPDERAFLTQYHVHGLGEFAYRNGIDLHDVAVVGPEATSAPHGGDEPAGRRPLIPFGGGLDTIVTVAALGAAGADAALCVVHPPDDAFAALEAAAAVTALPVVHVTRAIDPSLRRSEELGFFNGHVPITAVITAAALVAAVLGGRDAVVLSNEWSASVPTLMDGARPINHQWSKGIEFEEGFAQWVAAAVGPQVSVFSYLRSRSELWVAQQFAGLPEFHGAFRSCNRAFHQDRSARLGAWCGTCDKCCFIDLILSPFMTPDALRAVFDGHEPLENAGLKDRFLTLLGLAPEAKPFECVGDLDECRAAVRLAAARPDRHENPLLASLEIAVLAAGPQAPTDLLSPIGPHHIPDRYAPADLLVRAH
jgi:hypothetical protein